MAALLRRYVSGMATYLQLEPNPWHSTAEPRISTFNASDDRVMIESEIDHHRARNRTFAVKTTPLLRIVRGQQSKQLLRTVGGYTLPPLGTTEWW